MDLIPHSFNAAVLPQEAAQELLEGDYQGVHFTVQPEQYEWVFEKIQSWFQDRDEIILVDSGPTGKAELMFVILEWEGCQIDELFLAILRDEEFIEDYTVYTRSEEAYE